MKKIFQVAALVLIVSFLAGCTHQQNSAQSEAGMAPVSKPIAQSPSPASEEEESQSFTAKFEIYTNGTKRIFTESKYHNQSPDVFLENPDPGVVHVEKPGVTWNDFFQTLPFSLSKDCLVTGTKQTFCTNDSGKLRFFINDVESANALDLEIQENDFLQVRYGD